MSQEEKIQEWKRLFQRAGREGNLALEETALRFRKEIEKEFDIDTAELVEIAYRRRAKNEVVENE